MSDDSEFGPWVLHDGKGCPCVGQIIDFHCGYEDGTEQRHVGFVSPSFAASMVWVSPHLFAFLRYRIRKPRALLDLIQMIADLPAPVKTDGVIA